ncbi:FtsX-like permease family protein [Ruminococcaceae bacterium OttesenSCG-928-D13]|nr:FtsX-like permease family protein [Ruminococcaceae bacterium OttesenSCG-928-D13]
MRKLSFYPKLAMGNLWRNKSTYLPYLLACVVSVFTFYTMLAINLNGALDGIRSESVVKSFTAIGAIILALFCSALIFYTNSFLAKRRKKELGLYSILGMEKKNIGIVMFFETLLIAAAALVLGLLLGLLLSRLLFLVLLRLVQYEVTVDMPVSYSAIVITIIFFGAVFLLALLSNLRQVRLANPIDLMSGARQGEKEPRASWLLTLIGLGCLGGGYFIALYFRSPSEALMMFLVAVFLVIIGTFCLFTSGSIALLKLLRRNKNYYYTPRHFISVSGLIYRMKQNAAGLATIGILSCMVLVTVSATVCLYVGAENSLQTQYPSEYELSFDVAEDADTLLTGARQVAVGTGVELADLWDYRIGSLTTLESGGAFNSVADFDSISSMTMIGLMPLQDYNASMGENTTLAGDEALLFVTGGSYSGDTLTLDGTTYRVTHLDQLGTQKSGADDLGRTILLVLPDMDAVERALEARPEAVRQARPTETVMRRALTFNLSGDEAAKAQFLSGYEAFIAGLSTNGYFQYLSREGNRVNWYATNGGFLFLGIYFGILFLLAAALIIYYKQLSEGYDDAGRFEILQKVGMSEGEVRKTINGQILTVFFLPLVVAVVHIAVAFFPVSRAMVLFGVRNTPLLALSTLFTVLAYALVYLLVYRRTAKTYFRIVRRQAATA